MILAKDQANGVILHGLFVEMEDLIRCNCTIMFLLPNNFYDFGTVIDKAVFWKNLFFKNTSLKF